MRSIRTLGPKRGALLSGAAVLAGSLVPAALLQSPAAASGALVGTFTVSAGSCAGGTVTGSYFRMILQGGNAGGPYLSNSDSSCSDQSYTPMSAGTDGGLETGVYQPQPSPAFDSHGNALANRIISPANFYGVRYAASTQPTDPQTGLSVSPPEIAANGSTLSGTTQAVSVSWNNQYFNQGSPKPDGSSPGDTTPVAGTYDAATGAYTLQWTSQVVGGPFNGFSGLWHLTGRFVPASGSAGSAGAAAAPGGRGASTALPSSAASSTSGSSPSPGARSAGGAPAGATASAPGAGPSGVAGRELAPRPTRRSGLSPPTWLVALVIAAGALALAAFVLLRGRRPLRIASAAVVASALATLGTFALWPASVTTTVTHRQAAAAGRTGTVAPPQAAAPATSGGAGAATAATSAPATAVAVATSGATGSAPPAARTAPAGGGVPPSPAAAQCPIGLPAATNSGGLQSLVEFAPAFGPWSSEGFAMAPAYAPLLELFGPVIAQLAAQSPQAAPVLDPLLTTLQTLDTQGYATLSPLYGPYREQVLSAETRLATALAPFSEQLANSAAGSCLVDLESMLVSQAPSP